MRRIEAARAAKAASAKRDVSTFTWHFIGPQPINHGLPSFGGLIPGASFEATGRISAIAADPTTPGRIFVGAANGGVWMSTDDGASFNPIADSLPTQAIGAIALDPVNTVPPTIYVATGEGNGSDSYYGMGIFKSTDLGTSWSELSPGTFDDATFTKLAIDTTKNPPTLFAAVGVRGASLGRADPKLSVGDPSKLGLWRSTDGGASWFQYPAASFVNRFSSCTNCLATDVVIDPSDPTHVYTAIQSNGVFVSTDAGNSFALTFIGDVFTDRSSFSIGPPTPGAPLVCSNGAKPCGTAYTVLGTGHIGIPQSYFAFSQSTDGGGTWKNGTLPQFQNGKVTVDGSGFSQESYDEVVAASPSDPATVFFGGIGIYESTDSGADWAFLAGQGGTHSDQHAIAIAPDNDQVYLGNDGGAYKLRISEIVNGDATFTSLNATLSAAQIQGIGPHPKDSTRLLAGFQDNGTGFFTGGLGWVEVEPGDGGFTFYAHSNPRIAYHTFPALAISQQPGTIVPFGQSTDAGSSWTDYFIDFSTRI